MILKEIIKSNLCIGCGLCSIDSGVSELKFSPKNGCFIPSFNENLTVIADNICPGKGYNIKIEGERLYRDVNEDIKYDLELGYYDSFIAAKSLSENVLKNASSGGVITELLLHLIRNKIVDKVSITTFKYSQEGVSTHSYLTSNEQDILDAQGSKYCPVNLSSLIKEIESFNGAIAIVATPCSIAAIRQILKEEPQRIKANIKFFISNFCGGHKSMLNIKRLAEIHEINYSNIKSFRFRGGGQPGSLRFEDNNGNIASTQYPQYVGLTGESKMLRCHLCVDATGELADIACGDAWIPRFINSGKPWSIILTRNKKATDLIQYMTLKQDIEVQNLTIEELKYSQKSNLTSKKIRQAARMNLYKYLGYKIPKFDGGFYQNKTSIYLEMKVFFKHSFKFLLEKTSLYLFFYSKIKNK